MVSIFCHMESLDAMIKNMAFIVNTMEGIKQQRIMAWFTFLYNYSSSTFTPLRLRQQESTALNLVLWKTPYITNTTIHLFKKMYPPLSLRTGQAALVQDASYQNTYSWDKWKLDPRKMHLHVSYPMSLRLKETVLVIQKSVIGSSVKS